MCDQIGPQDREVMSLEKLALKQEYAWGWKKQELEFPGVLTDIKRPK